MKKLVILSLLLILAAAAWLARPVYRAHKEKKFAAQASSALAKKEFRNALLSAQQVLVLNSNNLAACRVMADLADLSRSPLAMVWRRRVVEIEPTLTNRLMLASCALRFEQAPFPITSQIVKELGESAPDDVTFHLVAAQLALKQNRLAAGEKHFEQAIRLQPTNELHRINLAIMRLESRNTNVSAQAHADLERLQGGAAWGVQAQRALMVHHLSRRQFAEAEHFSAALVRRTNSAFSDKLEHLTVLHGGKSPQLQSFVAMLQRDVGTNVFAAADLATRLTELGSGREAIAWAKSLPASMQDEPALSFAVASAYFSLRQWRELESALQAQQWKERDFVRQALLACALRQQKVTDVADVHWNEAVRLATTRPELLGSLAQMASAWGWTNEAETVLWRAAKDFPKERWPIESLQAGYVRMKNTRGLYELTTFALERQPTNFLAQNNWATLSFLLGTNLAKAHQLARQVYDRNTNNFGFVSTYAYSLHLQGKTTEALKIIETLRPAQLEDPSVASYYGVMLAAAGQGEKARRYLAKAEAAPILPEELGIIADARKKL
ncbi:MAG TPA: hypothetical protein VK846_00605 [Candidatus Limnocylindria bacterium]|nr:hypothetical protein [Candidatus Limnocylindria bacterium]